MTINYDEYNQGLIYYPFMVNLDRRNESLNTVHDPSGKIYAANITENLNLNVLNIVTRINESKTLTKHISYVNANLMVENVTQSKSGRTINVDMSAKIQENVTCTKKIMLGTLVHVLVKMVNI